MLTRAIAILLLCCSVSVNLAGLFVFAGFEINKTYIANELCINRNRPELHCNGKCYLMNKLKQAQDKEQKQQRQFQKIQLQLQEAIVALPYVFKQYSIAAINFRIPLTTGMPVARINVIFHPPQLG
ncbi:hypothetical protein [Pedobacter hartonius]|uniref:Uncharacterized protein n=1 Tax=Pedobacter hartonius TaxID=425514 RepID=A0A1H4D801_9SPHI|nr:hypothetical protein [Pedobacter hartonius]SEA68636.1 hypothetical protein SAMN05443550_104357 [Pedobacter hartonius]